MIDTVLFERMGRLSMIHSRVCKEYFWAVAAGGGGGVSNSCDG